MCEKLFLRIMNMTPKPVFTLAGNGPLDLDDQLHI